MHELGFDMVTSSTIAQNGRYEESVSAEFNTAIIVLPRLASKSTV